MSPDELALRSDILNGFLDVAVADGIVKAIDFQAVLGRFGLKFGDDLVDQIMLQCKIDGAGQVRCWNAMSARTRTRSSFPNHAQLRAVGAVIP